MSQVIEDLSISALGETKVPMAEWVPGSHGDGRLIARSSVCGGLR